MVLDNIKKVRDVLSDESKWTQAAYARDKDDIAVGVTSESACKWCLMGAIFGVAKDINEEKEIINCLRDFLPKIDIVVYNYDVVVYNDAEDTKYEDITNLLDKAIVDTSKMIEG